VRKERNVKLALGLWFVAVCATGLRVARPHSGVADSDVADESATATALEVEAVTHNFIAHILIPFWMLPGFGDYVCHRRSRIERTSGTHESLTHVLMIASTGAGVMTGLFFEINDSALLIMAASALFHEVVVLWDVAYAQKRRPPSALEQHMHSFLEAMPFTALASMCCLHPDATKKLFWQYPSIRRFHLERKRHPEPTAYIASVFILGALTLALPYAEEFIRCFKVDRTLLPRANDAAT